ncbi:MAG TPA: hypothetical protein VMP68_31285 [Candidatus Eisenbacteria bacterium]|nr:hypothetical protein [Candidatus Eisenbacteria bacterium]
MAEATMKHVRDYFNEGTDRPVTMTEFSDFWKSCMDVQKNEYKAAVAEILAAK